MKVILLIVLCLVECCAWMGPYIRGRRDLRGFAALRMTANNIEKSPLTTASRDARGLAIDAIERSKSGHLGLPLGCAELGCILWGKFLKYNPEDPGWINRDRFVLSAGHGSIFLYAWLHLAGYNITIDDLKAFRQLGSITPGHPEYCLSHGVEATTGPLGTGIGNAVGMAVAAKLSASTYNTEQHTILDHMVIALCGDGCLQEGVSYEAMAFAGLEGLDNLVVIYDSNQVTLDNNASFTQSEDYTLRFRAMNWNVVEVDGHDLIAIESALARTRSQRNGQPTVIIAHTIIGKGIKEVERTPHAHGDSGIQYGAYARRSLGLPEERFFVSEETRGLFQQRRRELDKEYRDWGKVFNDWKAQNPRLAKMLENASTQRAPTGELFAAIPPYTGKDLATRQSSSIALQQVARYLPNIVSGSADLFSSTKNYLEGLGDFGRPSLHKSYSGRNLHFGIREHGMGTILNGIAYYGLQRPLGATFLAFADYLRPAVRVAALARLPVVFLFTHDSIAVGEDGPTHQPVEGLAALRVIPDLHVIRPADPEEVVGAYAAALERTTGPTAIVLSRQTLPTLHEIDISMRREGVAKGGYIARKEQLPLQTILMASGSELALALRAADELGAAVRVVSMPCMKRFKMQSAPYQEEVLPKSCRCRVAVEAGGTDFWGQFVGLDGVAIGTDKFGLSGSGDLLMQRFGLTVQNVVSTVRRLTNKAL